MRTGSWRARLSSRRGNTFSFSASNASGLRKKLVTLIRMSWYSASHLGRVALQEVGVVVQLVELVQHHAARDAAVQRVELVVAEIDAGGAVQRVAAPWRASARRRARVAGARAPRTGAARCARARARSASGGSTKSTQPAAMALCGMPSCCALSSCAKVMPPSALIASSPSVPSLAVPERITPIAWWRRSSASERRN